MLLREVREVFCVPEAAIDPRVRPRVQLELVINLGRDPEHPVPSPGCRDRWKFREKSQFARAPLEVASMSTRHLCVDFTTVQYTN